jgi:haloacetate dehalogenase
MTITADFEPLRFYHDDLAITATVGGSGSPLLLLHGYPQTRRMWHLVAPRLAEHHTVVLADLRGYGDSGKPQPASDGTYSKRSMAADQLALMRSLGFERFGVAGHDRGGRVAHRMALDAPEAVERIAVLDIVPTLHMFEHVDRAMASSYFHWFFLALRNGVPERLLAADPTTWLRSRFDGRNAGGRPIDDNAYAEYERCFLSPGAIEASTADYQSAASIDLEHDREDRDRGRLVEAPLLALWGSEGYVGKNFDVLEVWRRCAASVRGRALHSDHYLAEEVPDEVADELAAFFSRPAADRGAPE